MPIAGFIDYVVQRTLAIAKEDVDLSIAACEVDVIANFDRDALRQAEARVRMRLLNQPADQMMRRAHKVLKRAIDLNSAGYQGG